MKASRRSLSSCLEATRMWRSTLTRQGVTRVNSNNCDADEFLERTGSVKGHAPGERLSALDIEAEHASFDRRSQREVCHRSYRQAGFHLEACFTACTSVEP